MQTVSGVKQNLWRRQQSGLYALSRRNFAIDGLVFYAPLWHPELAGSPFLSKDLNAHSCTVTGATWGSQGRTFDGTDDRVDAGNPAALDITGAITIELWFKTTRLATDQYILSKFAANYAACQYLLQQDGTDYLRFYSGAPGGAARASSLAAISSGQWYHVVGEWNGANTLMYLDTVRQTDAAGGIAPVSVATNVLFGGHVSGGEDWQGAMGEVRVYNRALSAVEVMHNYQSTKWRYL